MSDTGDALSNPENLKRFVKAARGADDGQQIIIVKSDNNGSGNSKLNSIVLGVASFAMGALLSLIIWQLNRLTDKVDDVNGRLIRVETKIGDQKP